jgi:uridine kinase
MKKKEQLSSTSAKTNKHRTPAAAANNTITVAIEEGKKKETIEVAQGISLQQLFETYRPRPQGNPVVAGKINYLFYDLWKTVQEPCLVSPVDLAEPVGVKLYRRGLILLFLRAMHELFPQHKVETSHSISRGVYCDVYGEPALTRSILAQIEARMRKYVAQSESFTREDLRYEEAIRLLDKRGMHSQLKLLRQWHSETVTFYHFGETISTCYGPVVPSAAYLKQFELTYYPPGVILRFPDINSPSEVPEFQEQSYLFRAFQEEKKVAKTIEVVDIGDLHEMISRNKSAEIIQICETIHEEKIANIAEHILRFPDVRLVLIAGPSSSGKTTFAKRLALHMRIHGRKTVAVSIDDYYKNRVDMPKDAEGKYDFENIEAIDVALLNQHLTQLLDGVEVVLPKFNFVTGEREEGKTLRIDSQQILILEGIHGLNDRLTYFVPRLQKFKIYVCALPVLKLDDHNQLSTSELRLVRRLVRDHRTRGHSAIRTLQLWRSVREGEAKYIFPYQDSADVFFNSSLVYELNVLKAYVEPLLQEIPADSHEFAHAMRLRKLLSYFKETPADHVPPISILREFIGKSCFE